MTEPNPKTDPEDELAGTEQPFVAHLMELRDRLIKALVAVGVVEGELNSRRYVVTELWVSNGERWGLL